MLQKRCGWPRRAEVQGRIGQAKLSEKTAPFPIVAGECPGIEKPEINFLIAHDFLDECRIGAVLGARNLQTLFPERQVIPGVKRNGAFRPDNDRTSREGRKIICLVGKRRDLGINRLPREKAIKIRIAPPNVVGGWEFGQKDWIDGNNAKQRQATGDRD